MNSICPEDPTSGLTTDAVIIAAGLGSRIRSLSASKPLTCVGGVSLLELAAWQLVQAGISRLVVVTGYLGDVVEAELPGIARRTGLEIRAERIADWTRPNGYSVIAGASGISGSYLLVMADHILSVDILCALLRARRTGVTLAIDRRLDSELIDPADATYVRTDREGLITAIGKHLPQPDAVDCGAFHATPELAAAIAAAIAQGKPGSLSDGMQILADMGRAGTVDIGDSWWIDIDDPVAHALAERDISLHIPLLATTA